MNSCSLPSSDFSITPTRSGSPLTIARAIFFACILVMCGGSGGISGSTLQLRTTGRSAASASSHAAPIVSALSQKMPLKPASSANSWYGKSGIH